MLYGANSYICITWVYRNFVLRIFLGRQEQKLVSGGLHREEGQARQKGQAVDGVEQPPAGHYLATGSTVI
jgi:hypothetical protein